MLSVNSVSTSSIDNGRLGNSTTNVTLALSCFHVEPVNKKRTLLKFSLHSLLKGIDHFVIVPGFYDFLLFVNISLHIIFPYG